MAKKCDNIAGKRTTTWLSLTALALTAGGASAVFAQDNQSAPPESGPATGPTITRPLGGFQLPPADDGRTPGVQGPSNNGLPPVSPNERQATPRPTPTPNVTPPRVTPAPSQSAPSPSASPSAARTTAQPRPQPAQASARPQPDATRTPAPDTVTPLLLPASETPSSDSLPDDSGNPLALPPTGLNPATPAPTAAPSFGWAWILAAILLALSGFLFWRRRRAATADGPSETLPTAREDAPAPPALGERATPQPAPPALAPEHAAPTSPAKAAARALGVDPDHRAASPLVIRPNAERRPQLVLSLTVQRISVTEAHIAVNFVLTIQNQGSADAVGVLARLALQQGSAVPEAVLARFYDGAGGSVLRDDMTIAVGEKEVLTTEVNLPRAGLEPIMMGGKPMLVPVLALDVTYHWDGPADAFGQVAQAYVLGQAPASGSDRLGPLRLDRASYVVEPASAHATSVQRRQ